MGPAMAAPDTFWITIHGRGGHAASPHQTLDPIVVRAQVVSGLQHIVSRAVDPLSTLVVSVTQFVGGTTHHVIPGSVQMQGTVRGLDPVLREASITSAPDVPPPGAGGRRDECGVGPGLEGTSPVMSVVAA